VKDRRHHYVTEREVVDLHDHALRDFGGPKGILDVGRLSSCLAMPRMSFDGSERYPTLPDKAAAYCFYIIKNHPFVDGNKRTAFLVAHHFMLINGELPRFEEEETEMILKGVASGTLGLDALLGLFVRAIENRPR